MGLLGVDVGERRVGIAVSDAEARFAVPHSVIDDRDLARSTSRTAEIVRLEAVDKVVVGLPLLPSGDDSESTRRARAYAERLGAQIEVPLEFFDERLSTYEAESSLRRAGIKARKARKRVDAHAAAVILQSYLDQNRSLLAK
jgi:putative Holliday junction resolvase